MSPLPAPCVDRAVLDEVGPKRTIVTGGCKNLACPTQSCTALQPQDRCNLSDLSRHRSKRSISSLISSIIARRGIHNEGARVLRERLDGKAEVDTDTARRLFTLICVLHWG